MSKKLVKQILEEYKQLLNYNGQIKIKYKSYKTKAASANLEKQEIVLNKHLLDLGEDVIRYLVLHELIHIKLNSTFHNDEFVTLLERYLPKKTINVAKNKIISKLLAVNGISRMRRISVD